MKSYNFIELADGSVNRRNKIVKKSEVNKHIKSKIDVYTTYFSFTDDIELHVAKKGTVAGYEGEHFAEYFPIDIDFKGDDNIKTAQAELITLLNELENVHEVNLKELCIYFSGNKGFHVLLPSEMVGYEPSKDLSKMFKKFAKELLKDVSTDLSIYDTTRLFRFPNTQHSKSMLYKIPLSVAEIYSLSDIEIKELAKIQRSIPMVEKSEVSENESLKSLFIESQKENQTPLQRSEPRKREVSTYTKLCYEAILRQNNLDNRNNYCMRLASHYSKMGYSIEITKGILQAWRQQVNYDNKFKEEEVNRTIKSVYEREYDFGCNDDLLKRFCNKKCSIYKNNNEKPYYTFDEFEYITTAPERIMSGITMLDEKIKGFELGCCTLWTGVTNSGKTTMLSQIATESIKQGFPIFFYNGEQTKTEFKNNIYKQLSTREQIFEKKYKNTNIIDSFVIPQQAEYLNQIYGKKITIYNNEARKDIDAILKAMEAVKQTKNIRIYILDNLMQIETKDDSVNQEQSRIMEKLRTFAVNNMCHVHVVAHPRKSDVFKTRLTLFDIAGTMNLVNKAYNVLAIIRVDMLPKDKEYDAIAKQMIKENQLLDESDGLIEILKTKGTGIGIVGMKYDAKTKQYKIGEKINESDIRWMVLNQKYFKNKKTKREGEDECPF